MWICIKLKRSSYWEKLGTTVLEHKHEKSIKSIFYEQPLRTQPLKSPSSLFIILRTSVMSADDWSSDWCYWVLIKPHPVRWSSGRIILKLIFRNACPTSTDATSLWIWRLCCIKQRVILDMSVAAQVNQQSLLQMISIHCSIQTESVIMHLFGCCLFLYTLAAI